MILHVPDWFCMLVLLSTIALTLSALHDFDSYVKHNRLDTIMDETVSFSFGDVLRDPKTRKRYIASGTGLHDARTGAVVDFDADQLHKLVKVGVIFNNLSKSLFNEKAYQQKPTGVKRYAFNGYNTLISAIQGLSNHNQLQVMLCESHAFVTKKAPAYKMLSEYETSEHLHASLIKEYEKYIKFGYHQVFVFSTLKGVHEFAEALRKHDAQAPVHEYTGCSKLTVADLSYDDVLVITVGMLSGYQSRRSKLASSDTVTHWCNLMRSPLVQAVRQRPNQRIILYASHTNSAFEIACLKHNIDEVTKVQSKRTTAMSNISNQTSTSLQ